MPQGEMHTVPVKPYPTTWRWIHWVTAIIVLSMIPAGLIMTRLPEGAAQDQMFSIHKSLGLTILALTIIRLTWKVTQGGPPAVTTLTPFERIASHSAHGLSVYLVARGADWRLVWPECLWLSAIFFRPVHFAGLDRQE